MGYEDKLVLRRSVRVERYDSLTTLDVVDASMGSEATCTQQLLNVDVITETVDVILRDVSVMDSVF